MPFTTAERAAMIERYAHGPTLLKRALAKVPADALKWKPAAGKWSAHEIVVHCADSETNAHMRLRYLIAEADPVRSEEHTSELQSQSNLVCRLLLEKKKKQYEQHARLTNSSEAHREPR